MKLSPALAEETRTMVSSFGSGQSREALFAYAGTTFQHLDPISLAPSALTEAQNRLRILSGQYGVLRPFDQIEAYRLEMKTPLVMEDGKKLTAFWKTRIASVLAEEAALQDEDSTVINLASGEYLAAVDKKKLKRRVITLHFKEKADGKMRTVGMYAKMARGKMLRSILSEGISKAEDIRDLTVDKYTFRSECGDADNWFFVRES